MGEKTAEAIRNEQTAEPVGFGGLSLLIKSAILYKRGKEIDNGGSGPLKMGHFPQTPIFPKWDEKGYFALCGARPEALPLDSASL